MKAFVRNDYPSVGVEQEFHLIDGVTGELTPRVDNVLENLSERLRGSVCYELFHSVLEHISAVCKTIDELMQLPSPTPLNHQWDPLNWPKSSKQDRCRKTFLFSDQVKHPVDAVG